MKNYFKKIITFSFILFFSLPSMAQPVSKKNVGLEDLRKLAECIAAYTVLSVSLQIEGDFSAYKMHADINRKLNSIFFNELTLFSGGNNSIYNKTEGLRNQELLRYKSMNAIQQIRFAMQVEEVNECLKITYFGLQ
jgi:hypothetical protein